MRYFKRLIIVIITQIALILLAFLLNEGGNPTTTRSGTRSSNYGVDASNYENFGFILIPVVVILLFYDIYLIIEIINAPNELTDGDYHPLEPRGNS